VEIRQLKYFMQIALDLNFSIAAKKLFVSQPALSWTIKQLENELGIKLFFSSGKKMFLTSDGEEFLTKAKYFLNEHQKIIDFYENRKDILTGHIQLGIPALFGTCFFIQTILKFRQYYPKIEVTMHSAGSIAVQEAVEAGKVDVGIVSHLFPSPNLEAIELPNITYPIVLVVSSKNHLATKVSVSFADLRDESFILLDESYTIGVLPVDACKKIGFTPNVVLRSSEWNVICEAVATSNNITILPYPFIDKVSSSALSFIPIINSLETTIPIAIISKKGLSKSLPLQKFISFLLDDILNNGSSI